MERRIVVMAAKAILSKYEYLDVGATQRHNWRCSCANLNTPGSWQQDSYNRQRFGVGCSTQSLLSPSVAGKKMWKVVCSSRTTSSSSLILPHMQVLTCINVFRWFLNISLLIIRQADLGGLYISSYFLCGKFSILQM